MCGCVCVCGRGRTIAMDGGSGHVLRAEMYQADVPLASRVSIASVGRLSRETSTARPRWVPPPTLFSCTFRFAAAPRPRRQGFWHPKHWVESNRGTGASPWPEPAIRGDKPRGGGCWDALRLRTLFRNVAATFSPNCFIVAKPTRGELRVSGSSQRNLSKYTPKRPALV